MEQLKTELLLIGKQRGDLGTTEEQKMWIDAFFEGLQLVLKDGALLSFTAEQLRPALIGFVAHFVSQGDLDLSIHQVVYLLHPSSTPRPVTRITATMPKNVTSIFQLRS